MLIKCLKFQKKKRRFYEIECEKTEYTMKDFFNHYGLCFIFSILLTKTNNQNKISLLDVNTSEKLNSWFIPLVISKKYYSGIVESIIHMILKTENGSDLKFFKDFKMLSFDLVEYLINNLNEPSQKLNLKADSIFEIIRKENNERDLKIALNLIHKINLNENKNLLNEVLSQIPNNKNEEILNIIKFFLLTEIKFNQNDLLQSIKVLCSNINNPLSNEEVKISFSELLKKNIIEENSKIEFRNSLESVLSNEKANDNNLLGLEFIKNLI